MSDVQPRLTKEQELRDAIEKARLPAREYRIYRALFARAEWKTAVIKRQFQPRSLSELADLAQMSRASTARGLSHLTRHGWILRHRHVTAAGIGGRGHGTRYELTIGADCDCGPRRPEPVPDAERMRQYRQRKKASQTVVTGDCKASQIDVTTGEKASQTDVTKRLSVRNEAAGQRPFSAKSVRDEGNVVEGESFQQPDTRPAADSWETWEQGSSGAAANRWPPARIPGVRGKTIPADEQTRNALHVAAACLGPVEILEPK